MKGLPTPRTVTGWLVSIVFTIMSLLIYYQPGVFTELLQFYERGSYKLPAEIHAYGGDIAIKASIPVSVSTYIPDEITLTVEAKKSHENVRILVESPGMLLCAKPFSEGSNTCEQYANLLDFGTIAQGQKMSKKLWVRVAPRTSVTQISFDFYYLVTGENDETLDRISIYKADVSSFQSNLDDIASIRRTILRVLLLPPLSNGFIPVVVLLLVYLFEHKIQPNQKSKWGINYYVLRALSIVTFGLLWFGLGLFTFSFFGPTNLLFGLTLTLVAWLVLCFVFPSTDLGDSDPLYRAKPKEPEIQQVSLDFTPVTQSLEKLSGIEKQIKSLQSSVSAKDSKKIDALEESLSRLDERLSNLRIKKSGNLVRKRQAHRYSSKGLPARQVIAALHKVDDGLQETNALLTKQSLAAAQPSRPASLELLPLLDFKAILDYQQLAGYLTTSLSAASRKDVEELLAQNDSVFFNLLALMASNKNPHIALADSRLFDMLKVHAQWEQIASFPALDALFPHLLQADFTATEHLLGLSSAINPDIFNTDEPARALTILTDYLKFKSRRGEQALLSIPVFDYLASIPRKKLNKCKKYLKSDDFTNTLFEQLLPGIQIPNNNTKVYEFITNIIGDLPDNLVEEVRKWAKNDSYAPVNLNLADIVRLCKDEAISTAELRERWRKVGQ